jgi:hypothetical protein
MKLKKESKEFNKTPILKDKIKKIKKKVLMPHHAWAFETYRASGPSIWAIPRFFAFFFRRAYNLIFF